MGKVRKCRQCGKTLPLDSTNARKFCDASCRVASRRRVQTALSHAGSVSTPEHIKDMVQLAFGAETQDVIREVLREEIRENITQAVRDNVLGAAEVMTQMLPKAMMGLIEDLDSEDWIVRSRAQALLFKYAMTFADKDGDKKELGRLTVIHEVNTPDTPLGRRMEEIANETEDPYIEDFEKDWPVCTLCDTRKHPDAVYEYSAGANLPARIVCKTCEVRRKLAVDRVSEYGLDNDLNRKLYE